MPWTLAVIPKMRCETKVSHNTRVNAAVVHGPISAGVGSVWQKIQKQREKLIKAAPDNLDQESQTGNRSAFHHEKGAQPAEEGCRAVAGKRPSADHCWWGPLHDPEQLGAGAGV